MSIERELADELRDAMKSKDVLRRDVIRQIQTEVSTARTAPDFEGDTDDAFYRTVIASYVKKMDKSRSEYLEMGERGERMAAKLGFEVDYLAQWLPTKAGEDETRELVRAAIEELGAAGDDKAAGRVTGHLMKTRGEDLDGGLVNRLVREELSSG
ncbi:MAG TPA: GatB/YqeY domain-containing protein [Acidimicrobiia bacterium]|nr:GatB/YqeY domain-containing protein [Acidimicrobiia bacterium]